MKVLVTGSSGQLGKSLQRVFSNYPQIEVTYTDIDTLDLTNRDAVERIIADNDFDYLVNCAAYTAVDKAESDDLMASRINIEAVGYIAQAASNNGVKVIHISTDYVFSGESFRPYNENDEPYPRSIYGRTKLEGEGVLTAYCPNSIIIRTAWLYSEYGNNFVKTMLKLASQQDSINVVSDQIGTPTYAFDLAEAILKIILHPKWESGIYHFTNEGVASWYDFCYAILKISGKDGVKVHPIPTTKYPTPAKRPLYSVLSKNKIKTTFNIEIPYWQDSLRKCLAGLKEINR